jgi:hypothetical protein
MGIYEPTMRMLATFNSESFQRRGLNILASDISVIRRRGGPGRKSKVSPASKCPGWSTARQKPAATVLCRGPGGATEAHDGVELVARLARLHYP